MGLTVLAASARRQCFEGRRRHSDDNERKESYLSGRVQILDQEMDCDRRFSVNKGTDLGSGNEPFAGVVVITESWEQILD